jgi:hypothetical protein
MTMPVFDVTIVRLQAVTISFKADTEEDAKNLAWDVLPDDMLPWDTEDYDILDVELFSTLDK